jgi:hypothetical protein
MHSRRRCGPAAVVFYLRWRRLIKLQKATKPTTMDPHTAATVNISSFIRENFHIVTTA